MRISLEPWAPGDLAILERANAPEMTRFVGGPETPAQVVARHERYLQDQRTGASRMFRIEADGEPVGGIGYWPVEHEGAPAYEAGWSVDLAWQGRGVATDALRQLTHLVAAEGDRDLLVAYPWPSNTASTAMCRRAGFELQGTSSGPWRGETVTYAHWVLDISGLDVTGRTPAVDERFAAPSLDETRWWPYCTPHWSSRAASAARCETGDGLTLRIDADTAPWAPDIDGDIRVSHLQTGQFSGPVGSGTGQHRFREGLAVREEQPAQRLWLVHHGVIEVRMAAIRHPDVMVACWPIGFEDRPDDCGEICIAEIFGGELDDGGGWVGVGVKPQNDPRLRADFEKVRVDGDLTAMHDYAVEWMPDHLRFFIDGRWVKTVPQRIDYPVQLMLDVYEFPRTDGTRDTVALPHRFRVERVRTFPLHDG